MTYTNETLLELDAEFQNVVEGMDSLLAECLKQSEGHNNPLVGEHLAHGSGRRIKTMTRSFKNVFALFPARTKKKLSLETLDDIQINLHAFFINLAGIFDNFAWAFVLRHDLEPRIGGRRNIGLFRDSTYKYFSEQLRNYLLSPAISNWEKNYLRSYRDSLAHRIPLYVPPYIYTENDAKRHNELVQQRYKAVCDHDFVTAEQINDELSQIGYPAFLFVPAFYELAKNGPIYLHPQLIVDGKTIIECGTKFFQNWDVYEVP